MVSAAQKAYDEWEQDEDGSNPELGAGGICQDVAEGICYALSSHGIDCTTLEAQVGDQHVWTIAWDGDVGYHIDIPPSVYETGSGYVWRKRKGVVFSSEHILISPADADTVRACRDES
jgi:hypothetical protein